MPPTVRARFHEDDPIGSPVHCGRVPITCTELLGEIAVRKKYLVLWRVGGYHDRPDGLIAIGRARRDNVHSIRFRQRKLTVVCPRCQFRNEITIRERER